MVDDCQRARPHELGGKVLEVKRAAPKVRKEVDALNQLQAQLDNRKQH